MSDEDLKAKQIKDMKIMQMLKSADKEMVSMGMVLLKEDYPAVWSGIVNLSGLGEITEEVVAIVAAFQEVQLGTTVRYRLPGSPPMVVTKAEVVRNNNNKIPGYGVVITVKYFNKSKQEFITASDRVEAFELVIEKTKKED